VFDWLVIGGGPHGVHAAARISAAWGSVRVGILDPHEEPFHDWDAVTKGVGMTHLRSPIVHHIGLSSLDLADFAREGAVGRSGSALKGRYRRPSLDLFNAHSRDVFGRSELADVWIRGRATAIDPLPNGWRIETDRGGIESRRIVLTIGSSQRLRWPDWAPRRSACVDHVLDPDRPPVEDGPVLVVGGGLSAAQTAVSLAGRGVDVTLLRRHLARVHRFDTDPGWLGPKRMREFRAEPSPDRRREMITEARHLGSVTSDALHALRASVARGTLQWRRGEVRGATPTTDGVDVTIDAEGGETEADTSVARVRRVLLATGYAPDASSPPWIHALGQRLGLPLARCGTPVPDTALQWAPGLHVTGPLAELELGPTSRNIAGARRAGDILGVVAGRVRPATAVVARSA